MSRLCRPEWYKILWASHERTHWGPVAKLGVKSLNADELLELWEKLGETETDEMERATPKSLRIGA